jgi:hypothetical protein
VKDFLGRQFNVGDYVVYPAGSGRSITMVKAQVVRFTDTSVVVQPLDSARWQQHTSTTKFRDTRTGKTFRPYSATSAREHMARPYGYLHKQTGEWVSYEDVQVLPYQQQKQYEWAPVVWKDYVEEIHVGPQPVRLTVTSNIIRIDAPEASA